MAGPPKRRPVYGEQHQRVNEELLRIQEEDEANRKAFERTQKELQKRREEALRALNTGGHPTPPASSVCGFSTFGNQPSRPGSTVFAPQWDSVAGNYNAVRTSQSQASEVPTTTPTRLTGFSALTPKRLSGFKDKIPADIKVIDLTAEEDPQTPTPHRSKERSNFPVKSPLRQAHLDLGLSGIRSKHASTSPSGKKLSANAATKVCSPLHIKHEKPSPSKKQKRTIPSDKETQIPFPQLHKEQFDRSAILRKPTITRSPSVLASIEKHDEQIDKILGTWSPSNSSDSDKDVEMRGAPLINGRPRLVVKLRFNAPRTQSHFKTISTPERAMSFRDSQTPRRRLPDLLYQYATPGLLSPSRNVTEGADGEVFKSPRPKKGVQNVPQFKMPGDPASARGSVKPSTPSRRKRKIIDDDDDDYDPSRATPAPEHLGQRPSILRRQSKSGRHFEDEGLYEEGSMSSLRRQFGLPSKPAKDVDASDKLFISPPPAQPAFSSPSKKAILPRGLRGSMAATPTSSDLGSPRPAPKRRRHEIDLSDNDDDEYKPSQEASQNEDDYTRPTVIPKPGRKKSKFATSAANNNGQEPAAKRSKIAPSTPTKTKPSSKPSTPGAPKPNRYKDIDERDTPVSPIQSLSFSAVSALGISPGKRKSRAQAEQKLKEHAQKDAELAAKTEEEHLEELGGRLSTSVGGGRQRARGNTRGSEESMQSVESPMRSLSLTPAAGYSRKDWLRDRCNGDRVSAKMSGASSVPLEDGRKAADGADLIYDQV